MTPEVKEALERLKDAAERASRKAEPCTDEYEALRRAQDEFQALATPSLVLAALSLPQPGREEVVPEPSTTLPEGQSMVERLVEALEERERLALLAHDALEAARDKMRGAVEPDDVAAYQQVHGALYAIRSRKALALSSSVVDGARTIPPPPLPKGSER